VILPTKESLPQYYPQMHTALLLCSSQNGLYVRKVKGYNM